MDGLNNIDVDDDDLDDVRGAGGAPGSAERPWFCYVLSSGQGCRYVGATVNPGRRLRQHNGEITGGARRTARRGPWTFAAVLSGFDSNHEALRAEWRLKRLARNARGAVGVVNALCEELRRRPHGRWTGAGDAPFSEQSMQLAVTEDVVRCAPGLSAALQGVGWTLALLP